MTDQRQPGDTGPGDRPGDGPEHNSPDHVNHISLEARVSGGGTSYQANRDQHIHITPAGRDRPARRTSWLVPAVACLAAVAVLAVILAVLNSHRQSPQSGSNVDGAAARDSASADPSADPYSDGCVAGRGGTPWCFVWDHGGAQEYAAPTAAGHRIGRLDYGPQPFSCQTRGGTAGKADVGGRRYENNWWLRYAGSSGTTAWVNAVDIMGGGDYESVPHLREC